VPGVDKWLTASFRPAALERTVRAMLEAQPTGADRISEEARQVITACDAKLRQHRAALEAGADPALIAGWMAETQAERDAAQRRIQPASRRGRLSQADIADLIASVGDLTSVLASADAAAKAEIYRELGLRLTYSPQGPQGRTVQVEAKPFAAMYVRKCPRGTRTLLPQCERGQYAALPR
jgi:site-specific DNA recombinase